VIVSLLTTIAAQDLKKIAGNTPAALAKKKATCVQLRHHLQARTSPPRYSGSRFATLLIKSLPGR
jgi:hypothetical protein